MHEVCHPKLRNYNICAPEQADILCTVESWHSRLWVYNPCMATTLPGWTGIDMEGAFFYMSRAYNCWSSVADIELLCELINLSSTKFISRDNGSATTHNRKLSNYQSLFSWVTLTFDFSNTLYGKLSDFIYTKILTNTNRKGIKFNQP